MRRTLMLLGTVWACALLGLASVTATFATEQPAISELFRQAIEKVERERGRKLALDNIIYSAETKTVGYFGLSKVSVTVFRDNAGLKAISADRRGATDTEWGEAIGVLVAVMEPEVAIEERQQVLAELQTARLKGERIAKQVSRTWIMAATNPREGETWFAFQIGVKVNDKVFERPPAIFFTPRDGR